jgi:hypothetical protein
MLKSSAIVTKIGYSQLNLDDSRIMSINHTQSTISGEDFEIGSTCAAELDVEISNLDGSLSTNAFQGGTVTASIGVQRSDLTYEYCPLGVFFVDSVTKTETSIKIKCYDSMVLLETPYVTSLKYPATLLQIAQNIATKSGLTLANTTFPNASFSVSTAPSLAGVTLRTAIGWVAEAAACFARINRAGQLDINFYAASAQTITAANYFKLLHDDLTHVAITKVTLTQSATGTSVSSGSAGNTYTITDNPLLAYNPNGAIAAIYDQLHNFTYMPFASDWQGNPAFMAGDIITIIDRNNNSYTTILTESDSSYEGGLQGSVAAKSLTAQGQAFTTPTAITQAVTNAQNAATAAGTAASTALTNSTQAITSASGKNAVYYGTVTPIGTFTSGDLWFNTGNGNQLSIWNGTAWVLSQFGNLAVTGLDAGAITTGYLAAARIAAGSITVYSITSQSDPSVYATMTTAGLSLYKSSALSLTITADSGLNYASIIPKGAYNGLWLGTDVGSNTSANGLWITSSGCFFTTGSYGQISIGYGNWVTFTDPTGTVYPLGGASGARWSNVPIISTAGVMEIGQYIDFHESNTDTSDYSSRLYSSGGAIVTMGNFTCKGQITCSSTYPQVIGDGTTLQLSNSSASTAGIVIQGGTCRPAKDNQLNLGASSQRWATVYAVTSTINTSDKNEKNTIAPLNADKATKFISALNPVSYKYNSGTSDRLHYGMIAQDVEDEMTALGMTSADFAGFIKSPKTDEDGNNISAESGYIYGLRYEEFIAPLIKTVQNLLKRCDVLEKK